MPSRVSTVPAAPSAEAFEHFLRRLGLETDCWDVADALGEGIADFVLVDVRSAALYAAGHVPGAINIPHREITSQRMAEWPEETLFVVYGAGPHCNGGSKAALKLASLERPVKEMIGGMAGWSNEGYPVITAQPSAARTEPALP
jgi:rhodanese-related sulfurtransferase